LSAARRAGGEPAPATGGQPPADGPVPDGVRIVRVGVTGHRTFDDPEGAARRVRKGLQRVLALAGDEGDGAQARLEMISALAEGADRLVAREALALPGTTLSVVLPFPVDDYARDFETQESKREYAEFLAQAQSVEVMPPTPTREAGYEMQGRWIADRCDVLVAVWDGGGSRGQGGTAEIVAYASERGALLLWVKVERP
jgi:hypothetical protein